MALATIIINYKYVKDEYECTVATCRLQLKDDITLPIG